MEHGAALGSCEHFDQPRCDRLGPTPDEATEPDVVVASVEQHVERRPRLAGMEHGEGFQSFAFEDALVDRRLGCGLLGVTDHVEVGVGREQVRPALHPLRVLLDVDGCAQLPRRVGA